MYEHLWTGGPAPPEYIEMKLCERFGCMPSQLRKEKLADVLDIIDMIDVESKVKKRNG